MGLRRATAAIAFLLTSPVLAVAVGGRCSGYACSGPLEEATSLLQHRTALADEELSHVSQMAELFRVSATAEDCGNVSRAGHGGGASYYFCERALSKSLNATDALGLSFGIFTWDAWGEAMAKRFSLQTKLFDCYTTQAETPALGSRWAVKPQREDACVAGSSFTDESGRIFRPLGAYLAGRPPRGTAVKMDVEGSEWDALSAASDEELRMIDHLDMELHFCLPSAGWPLAQKVAVLKRLDRFFKVVDKFWDDSYFQGFSDSAVCDKTQKNALGRSFQQMLSISYVNRELTASG